MTISTEDPGAIADEIIEKQNKPLSELSLDEAVERLATLPPLEYEQQRKGAAEALSIERVTVLDKEVARARKGGNQSTGQGQTIELHEPEPWHEPVDGALVLDMAAEAINRHMVIREVDTDAAVLWAVHTHIYSIFSHTPRLIITAPDAECGKTVLMTHMVGNLATKAQPVEIMKPAPFFRLAEAFKPTFLIDEADVFLREDSDLIAAINNGWEPHGGVPRCVGDDFEVRLFSTHCPVVLAGIEMQKHLPTTTISRSIVIHLERAADDEIDTSNIYDKRSHRKYIRDIGRMIARWSMDNRLQIASHEPAMPNGVRNRLADKWRPLFSIAEIAGGNWLKRAELSMLSQVDMAEPTKALHLLSDMVEIMADLATGIHTTDLITKLCGLPDTPWFEYNFRDRDDKRIKDRQIARLLKRYSLHPEPIRLATVARGYYKNKVDAVARRYLQELSVTTLQTSNSNEFSDSQALQNVTDRNASVTNVTDRKPVKANDSNGCNVVTDDTRNTREAHAQNWRSRLHEGEK